MTALIAVLAFGLLVFVHELGHFIFAKLFGVYVEKFSIGFGPKVAGKKIGETEYLISAIPLGGYVKMYGEHKEDEIKEELRQKAFTSKKLYEKSLIVFAGPLFNYLFAVVLFWIVFLYGVPTFKPVIGQLSDNMPAKMAGLMPKDEIISINGMPVKTWDEMAVAIRDNPGRPLIIDYKRNGVVSTVQVTPVKSPSKNIFGETIEIGMLGITPSGEKTYLSYGFFESFKKGFMKCYEIVELTVLGIVKMFERVIPADNIGGPIMIFQMTKDAASFGFAPLMTFVAVISINLAILNLLPIPVLDGGYILMYAIEAAMRKPLSEKTKMVAMKIGMSLLIMLMIFAFYNDIMRLFKN